MLHSEEEVINICDQLLRMSTRYAVIIFQSDRLDIETIKRLDEAADLFDRTLIALTDCRFHMLFEFRKHLVELFPAGTAICFVFQQHRFRDLLPDLNDRIETGKRILEDHRDLIAADLVHIVFADL